MSAPERHARPGFPKGPMKGGADLVSSGDRIPPDARPGR